MEPTLQLLTLYRSSIPFLLYIFFYFPCVPNIANAALSSTDLFKNTSPAVVLLLGEDSLETGSIVNATDILTNWHVVEGNSRVLVAFKPRKEGAPLDPDEFVVGDVIKLARDKDLAIVRVKRIPSHVHPLQLGSPDEIEIGADVHAIGHPSGEIWTYTKGVISQVRKNFVWKAGEGKQFQADVIQTQTPINPGNSGGPLLSVTGRIVGVNAFKAIDAEGLNFAISLSELSAFLESAPKKEKTPQPKGNKQTPPKKKGLAYHKNS